MISALEGNSIGRYHILEKVGEGGMSIVYKAYDTRLERNVAIKIIRKDVFSPSTLEGVLKRFEREAISLAKLSHPNILKVIDYGEFEGAPYLVLEFLSGGTLKDRLGRQFTYREACQILEPISRALDYAHQRNIIHRDIKPSNIMITDSGEPMLTDFGIAKILRETDDASLTGTGVGIGTPEYMAPEQGMGSKVDARVDVYSLGVVLFEMVTGRKPYTADTPMAVVLKHITDPLPSPRQFIPELPEEVEGVILKSMAKDRENRYLSMAAFSSAIKKLAFSGITDSKTDPGIAAAQRAAENTVAKLTTPGETDFSPTAKQADQVAPPEVEKKPTNPRFARFETMLDDLLKGDDFEGAEAIIKTMSGMGAEGQQTAARLKTKIEDKRRQIQQQEANIKRLKISIESQVGREDFTQAERLLIPLEKLGPIGQAEAARLKTEISKARQRAKERSTEIERLSKAVQVAIAAKNWDQAGDLIQQVHDLGYQGLDRAKRLQDALDKARREAPQPPPAVSVTAAIPKQKEQQTVFQWANRAAPAAQPGADRKTLMVAGGLFGSVIVVLIIAIGAWWFLSSAGSTDKTPTSTIPPVMDTAATLPVVIPADTSTPESAETATETLALTDTLTPESTPTLTETSTLAASSTVTLEPTWTNTAVEEPPTPVPQPTEPKRPTPTPVKKPTPKPTTRPTVPPPTDKPPTKTPPPP